MQPFNHNHYILTPISEELQNAISSINALGDSMEVAAVQEMFVRSLFLQLTGALEQKAKCICWMLAQYDLDYRRSRFFTKWELSECSTLKDKNEVFCDIVKYILKVDTKYKVFKDPGQKTPFINKIFNEMYTIFEDSNLMTQRSSEYKVYKEILTHFQINNIEAGLQMFKSPKSYNVDELSDDSEILLSTVYTQLLYPHRNRLAHNTLSYQDNLPGLIALLDEKKQRYSNIFLYITILIIIDELYRRIYSDYIHIISIL